LPAADRPADRAHEFDGYFLHTLVEHIPAKRNKIRRDGHAVARDLEEHREMMRFVPAAAVESGMGLERDHPAAGGSDESMESGTSQLAIAAMAPARKSPPRSINAVMRAARSSDERCSLFR